MPDFRSAFVTGATGVLGNNLVRLLCEQNVRVTALARNPEKAKRQFGDLPIEIVIGDMARVESFSAHLPGHDVLLHTAAEFRDAYAGGSRWKQMEQVNVQGTLSLLNAARDAGIDRFVHTSSTAVLWGERGAKIDETMLREELRADDYFRSKIQSEKAVFGFLEQNPGVFGVLILPGWMHGPGDLGPTSAGRMTLDFLHRRLPGIPPGEFAFVDARDVAQGIIAAADKGRRGERYLVAGRPVTLDQVFAELERVTGIPAPKRRIPLPLVALVGLINELKFKVTGRPATLSWAAVKLLINERGRRDFDSGKAIRELGVSFRPMNDTLLEEVNWYKANGFA